MTRENEEKSNRPGKGGCGMSSAYKVTFCRNLSTEELEQRRRREEHDEIRDWLQKNHGSVFQKPATKGCKYVLVTKQPPGKGDIHFFKTLRALYKFLDRLAEDRRDVAVCVPRNWQDRILML
jgi:hypothetical protein